MDGFEIFEKHEWHPFSVFGFNNPLLALEQHTIIYTWVALAIITLFALSARLALLYYPDSLLSYLIKKYVQFFKNSIEQACHFFSYRHTAFIISLFTFLVVCNCIVLIPTMEEPTKDLNTTVALALVSFLYVQTQGVKSHGIIGYLHEYFKTPLQVFGLHPKMTPLALLDISWRTIANMLIGLLTFPIELLGKLASVLSLSFRLFGNIFGGAVISSLFAHFSATSLFLPIADSYVNIFINLLALPFSILLSTIISLFFGLFEGILQAAVFSMLTIMYLGNAIATHPDEGIS